MKVTADKMRDGILPLFYALLLPALISYLTLWSGYTRASETGLPAKYRVEMIQYDEADTMTEAPDELGGDIYQEYPVSEQERPVELTEPYVDELPSGGSEYHDYPEGDMPVYNEYGEEIFSGSEGPLVDEPYPLVDQPEPLVDMHDPLVSRPAPLVEQPYPLVDQEPPLVEHTAPLVRQPAPLVRQSRPLVNQPAPLVRQSAPLVKQPAPLVRQPSPLVGRPAPLVR